MSRKKEPRITILDCDESKKDTRNTMRCDMCEYTQDDSHIYCNGICNKPNNGKLRLCNIYTKSCSDQPYFCWHHNNQKNGNGFQVDGIEVRIYIDQDSVKYYVYDDENNRYTEKTEGIDGKNRFLIHKYDLKTENLRNLPEILETQIYSGITDDEMFINIFLEDSMEKARYYAQRKKRSTIEQAISERVAQFQPVKIDNINVTSKNLAIMALRFMLGHDIQPDPTIAKTVYNKDQLLRILTMCSTSEVFRTFVEQTKMLSRHPYPDILTDIIIKQTTIEQYGNELLEPLKYVFSCISPPNDDIIPIVFLKFLFICNSINFDDAREIYKFFAEQKISFTQDVYEHYYYEDYSGHIHLLYSKEAIQDIIDTYGYYAYPRQEVILKEEEKKDRLDPGWLQRNVFTYDDGKWELKDRFPQICYYSRTNIGYFKRKMISLGYPEECLGVMSHVSRGNVYYIKKDKFKEIDEYRSIIQSLQVVPAIEEHRLSIQTPEIQYEYHISGSKIMFPDHPSFGIFSRNKPHNLISFLRDEYIIFHPNYGINITEIMKEAKKATLEKFNKKREVKKNKL
jgi:hypothetical protein